MRKFIAPLFSCMVWQMEDINLLGKRDVVTLSTSGGAIVDWSIIGAPQLSKNDMHQF